MKFWKKSEIVVLDIETTGLSSDDQIIQVGMVRAKYGVVHTQTETLINPQKKMSEGAIACHGITDDMVSWRPSIDAYRRHMQSVFNGCDGIIAHNAEFDLRFIRKIKGLEITNKIPYYCTMRRARQLGLSGKLADMAKQCGISCDSNKLHGALYDAQVTFQLFCKITPDNFSMKGFFHGYL